jgi:hypothetical protein
MLFPEFVSGHAFRHALELAIESRLQPLPGRPQRLKPFFMRYPASASLEQAAEKVPTKLPPASGAKALVHFQRLNGTSGTRALPVREGFRVFPQPVEAMPGYEPSLSFSSNPISDLNVVVLFRQRTGRIRSAERTEVHLISKLNSTN